MLHLREDIKLYLWTVPLQKVVLNMPLMQLFPAGAPELVRSNQKDRFYTDYLTSLLSEVSRQVLPLRIWLRWQREFQLLAELGYYGITTVIGNQTLGEEYCNIVQVTPTTPGKPLVAPGFLRRTIHIIIQTFGVYALEKGLEVIYKRIRDRRLGLELSEENYEWVEKLVGSVEDIFTGASRLHLAFFYMYGIFYRLGKRLLGVKYLMVRYANTQETPTSATTTYRVLGYMILLQIFVKLYKWCRSKQSKDRGEVEEDNPVINDELGSEGGRVVVQVAPINSRVRCPSCLEECHHPTASLCGHIFCWSCISDWTSEKAECPVCRTAVKPHQIISLQHFQS